MTDGSIVLCDGKGLPLPVLMLNAQLPQRAVEELRALEEVEHVDGPTFLRVYGLISGYDMQTMLARHVFIRWIGGVH